MFSLLSPYHFHGSHRSLKPKSSQTPGPFCQGSSQGLHSFQRLFFCLISALSTASVLDNSLCGVPQWTVLRASAQRVISLSVKSHSPVLHKNNSDPARPQSPHTLVPIFTEPQDSARPSCLLHSSYKNTWGTPSICVDPHACIFPRDTPLYLEGAFPLLLGSSAVKS